MGKAPADEDSDKAAPVSEDSRSYPTFSNIATKVANLLRLGKVQINSAILSTFRNIGFAEVTPSRKCKEKVFTIFLCIALVYS